MKIAIAQAYNGIYKYFNQHLKKLGAKTFYFNIDRINWVEVSHKQPDAYIWLADNKEERYRELYDKVYFIEHILNKPVFPDMQMYFAEGDKAKQYQVLKYLNIPTPKTYIATDKNQALKIIQKINYPFVLKDPYGYSGQHVFKINSNQQAMHYIMKIFNKGLTTNYSTCQNIFYAQEFIQTNRDLRVITIGHKVYCAYWRVGQNGSWKYNLDQGAKVDFGDIPQEALALCLKVSKRMGFHWMGYDLLVDGNKNVKMIEYSSTVRVKGAQVGGYDVRRQQARYIYNYLTNINS